MGKGTALGTVLKIGTTAVASLTSIGGPSRSADTVDVTALDSADGYREFIGDLKDGGEVSISGFFNFSDAGQTALEDAFEDGEAESFSIVYPTAIGATDTFSAIVTALETGAELGNAVTFDATLKITGKPTRAATT